MGGSSTLIGSSDILDTTTSPTGTSDFSLSCFILTNLSYNSPFSFSASIISGLSYLLLSTTTSSISFISKFAQF